MEDLRLAWKGVMCVRLPDIELRDSYLFRPNIRVELTGQSNDTRRLVVAISLSGSAVNFSLTAEREQGRKN